MSTERQSRLVSWASPEIFREAVRSGRFKTGRDFLQAFIDGDLPRPPISELLDYGPTLIEDGRTIFEMVPQDFHYNPIGSVHGGVAAALLDTVMACAIHTRLAITEGYTTLELKVNYLRPLTSKTGRVRGIGEVVHLGRRTGLAEGRVLDAQDRIYAHASTTCLILR